MCQLLLYTVFIARLNYLSMAEGALRVAAIFLGPIFGFAQGKGSFVATIVPVVINMKDVQTGTREGASWWSSRQSAWDLATGSSCREDIQCKQGLRQSST